MCSTDGRNHQQAVLPHWKAGTTSLTRIVESEGPLLSPFELLPDCTVAHIEQNLPWLAPRFYDPA
ncbi:hypothetical protein WB403_50695, partial [Streptomyces brasiliscabiei]